ncbi:MAG: carbohydrate binding family 9 domain-containing protein, partial [Gemmatimonadetes bacterium]|nr:carbohydrate binding family 9 domain-containing protein [Gemmatimonadota bacterium]
DQDAIYVGAWLYDADPTGIVRGETRRDARIDDTDAFLIVLDTYHDRQNAFVFGTTPAGIEYDGQVVREGTGSGIQSSRQQGGATAGFNLNWDGSWEVATSADAQGWYAEFRIPFSTLRYGQGGEQTWGLNLARHIRRRNEQAFWSPVGRQFTLWRVSSAGTLDGIEAPVRRTVQITPYSLASTSKDYTSVAPAPEECARLSCRFEMGSYAGDVALGGDAKLGLTPSLTLDLTYNTDFAQVEVDEQQVNLTRFTLFFPEKRPFFLENAGSFSVGSSSAGGGQAVEMFFSRRIGIGPDGVPVPIVGGGRLTGKLAGLTVGLLDIQTDDIPGVVPANNYAVGRLARELPNRSRIGAMVIHRTATALDGDYNRTYLADGRLGIGRSVTIDAFGAVTETPSISGREHALNLSGAYNTRTWVLNTTYTEVGDNFNPEVGFLERSGYRFASFHILRHVRFANVAWLRELRPHVSYRGYWGFDGFNQTRTIHFDSHVELADGAFFSPAFNLTREGLQAPFEIDSGVVVPPDTYDNFEAAWRWNSNEGAPVSINGSLDWGGFLSGTRRGVHNTLTVRAGVSFASSLRVSYNNLDLAEGSFSTTLIALRLAYNFTPRMYLQSLVQYNEQAGSWSGNVRYGWLNTAGTGLFVVVNESHAADRWHDVSGPLGRAVIVKFTRQFNVVL